METKTQRTPEACWWHSHAEQSPNSWLQGPNSWPLALIPEVGYNLGYVLYQEHANRKPEGTYGHGDSETPVFFVLMELDMGYNWENVGL